MGASAGASQGTVRSDKGKKMIEVIPYDLSKEKELLESLLKQKQDLLDEKKRLFELEKSSDNKYELFKQRNEIAKQIIPFNDKIICQTNIVLALENAGSLVRITDKNGKTEEKIPDFRKVNSEAISFDEETILLEKAPGYVPVINEEEFSRKGYVFDALRIDSDTYIVSAFSYSLDRLKCFFLCTLDQLALISDYYYTKAKATETQKAEDSNKRAEERWDRLPEDKRKYFYEYEQGQSSYSQLPARIKKEVTLEKWKSITWQEREKIYKFYKRTGPKRLTSKLDERHMWQSYHQMYEVFINPEAKNPQPRVAHPETFAYWTMFRNMLDWKIKDIKIQREVLSDIRRIALETSFGNTNVDFSIQQETGLIVKRQDGTNISIVEINQIKKSWESIQKIFGDLSEVAREDKLKVSHTQSKYVFASKYAGVFIPSMLTIAVTNKFGSDTFDCIFAHEAAHYIDNVLGRKVGKRHLSDDFESIAGLIANAFRANMNQPSKSDYVNSTVECFARALEQYYAIETFGDDARIQYSYKELDGSKPYVIQENYVSKEKYYSVIKPLIEAFFIENKEKISIINADSIDRNNQAIESKMKNKKTIKDQVKEYAEELKSMSSTKELRDWAISKGMDNRSAFPKFKDALLDIGIDYEQMRSDSNQNKADELESQISHEVTLFSDYKSSQNRFAITDQNGNVLWYGICFDCSGEQSDGELDAAKKAVWLASKIKESLSLSAIQLNLYVDAQWLTYQTHPGQKGYALTILSKKYNVKFNIEWIPGSNNPADRWTVSSGFKKWSDNNLPSLATVREKSNDFESGPVSPDPQPEPPQEKIESLLDCLTSNGISLERDIHRFEIGSEVTDISAGKKYIVSSMQENQIELTLIPAFEDAPKETIKTSFKELVERFRNDQIQVKGFERSEIMEFARVLNTIDHCMKMDRLFRENQEIERAKEELEAEKEVLIAEKEIDKSTIEKESQIVSKNYFLRFTENPEMDLKNKKSYHWSDDGTKEELPGLCGFSLDSLSISNALDEAKNRFANMSNNIVYNIDAFKDDWAIYEGVLVGSVPDGDVFYPKSIAYNPKKNLDATNPTQEDYYNTISALELIIEDAVGEEKENILNSIEALKLMVE